MITGRSFANHAFLRGQPDLYHFFEDPANWDTIANLHLLDDALNKSKNDQPLKQWFQNNRFHCHAHDPRPNLPFLQGFPSFVEARGKALTVALKKLGNV